MTNKTGNGTEEPLEKQLWKAADKLRKNIDAVKTKTNAVPRMLSFCRRKFAGTPALESQIAHYR